MYHFVQSFKILTSLIYFDSHMQWMHFEHIAVVSSDASVGLVNYSDLLGSACHAASAYWLAPCIIFCSNVQFSFWMRNGVSEQMFHGNAI